MSNPKTIGMISLGCPKNQVDAELMLAKLSAAGYNISDEMAGCDAVIINTCGFIDDAKREGIDNILEVAEYKAAGLVGKIIVTGCMAERYHDQIMEELPETDCVVGLGDDGNIVDIVRNVLEDNGPTTYADLDKLLLPLEGQRVLTTPNYWAYLKISEGCSNNCAFCAIPGIRGKFRSRSIESILQEAKDLADAGVKEVILVGQDTGLYGKDLYGSLKLAELLNRLCEVDGLEWIRFLYTYPERITDELLDTMAAQKKICHYLDIPLQHADGTVLRAMHRPGNAEQFLGLINHIKEKIPDICIRTTVMAGFPGETEAQFNTLADFVQAAQFDNLGCFAFSPEEGTAAAAMDGQLEDEIKLHRRDLIMEQQYPTALAKNQELVGQTLQVMVDGFDPEAECYVGRSYRNVPEIDGVVFFGSSVDLEPGTFVPVEIAAAEEYDLIGQAQEDYVL
jgi:ribosomal protein S12 methylthiotransferase